jgi:hypothetical protein
VRTRILKQIHHPHHLIFVVSLLLLVLLLLLPGVMSSTVRGVLHLLLPPQAVLLLKNEIKEVNNFIL